jgi:predicted nucleotidyltransferase
MLEDAREVLKLSEMVAGRLGRIGGVEAVALGGSWAREEAHPDSDVDLGIYYHTPKVILGSRTSARWLKSWTTATHRMP